MDRLILFLSFLLYHLTLLMQGNQQPAITLVEAIAVAKVKVWVSGLLDRQLVPIF